MPEERLNKSSLSTNDIATENGTNSPNKSPRNRGKMTIAKITLLDSSVKDFPIEVSFCF